MNFREMREIPRLISQYRKITTPYESGPIESLLDAYFTKPKSTINSGWTVYNANDNSNLVVAAYRPRAPKLEDSLYLAAEPDELSLDPESLQNILNHVAVNFISKKGIPSMKSWFNIPRHTSSMLYGPDVSKILKEMHYINR